MKKNYNVLYVETPAGDIKVYGHSFPYVPPPAVLYTLHPLRAMYTAPSPSVIKS